MVHYFCPECEKREPADASHNFRNYLTVNGDALFRPDAVCAHCGHVGLNCAHNDPNFDEDKLTMICGDCKEQCGFTTLPLALT